MADGYDLDEPGTTPGAPPSAPPPAALDGPYVDEPGPAGAPGAETPMELLQAELTETVDLGEGPKTVTLVVPGRPGWAVRYRCDIDGDTIDRSRAQSTRRKGRRGQEDDLDTVAFNARICVKACDAILRGGVEVTDDAGNPWRFTHTALQDVYGCRGNSVLTARKFYARDASLDSAASRVITDSGWGEDLAELDEVTGADPPAAPSSG